MAETGGKESPFRLRGYPSVLRRPKGGIGIAVLIAVGASLASSFIQTPVYQGEAQLLIKTRGDANPFNNGDSSGVDPIRETATAIKVIESGPVKDLVRTKIGVAPDVSAEVIGET